LQYFAECQDRGNSSFQYNFLVVWSGEISVLQSFFCKADFLQNKSQNKSTKKYRSSTIEMKLKPMKTPHKPPISPVKWLFLWYDEQERIKWLHEPVMCFQCLFLKNITHMKWRMRELLPKNRLTTTFVYITFIDSSFTAKIVIYSSIAYIHLCTQI